MNLSDSPSAWTVPSGRTWDGTAAKVGDDGGSWDGNCVGFKENGDGTFSLADTKVDLAAQTPLTFTEKELDDFAAAWLARRG